MARQIDLQRVRTAAFRVVVATNCTASGNRQQHARKSSACIAFTLSLHMYPDLMRSQRTLGP